MKNHETKIRIKDIAILAGVSEGTVDRVLHNRGEVSQKSLEAVNKVLEEINYSPNLLARSLASKKTYTFVCMIPVHQPDDYWESIEDGFFKASREFIHYNINLKKTYFDQFDVNSFLSTTQALNFSEIDGVVIAPIFREETISFTKQLQDHHIPFSFIDSMIEEVPFLTYYGQNSFQSGYVAAKLLLSSMQENSRIIVVRTKRKGSASNQTKGRINGFMEYIARHNMNNISLINIEMRDNDDAYNSELLQSVFQENKNVRALITFNSKIYKLVEYMSTIKTPEIKVIGYDLLQQNIRFMKEDKISYLIGQRPDKQAYITIRDMCNAVILKQETKKTTYVPIDILIKENIEDYLNFE